MPPCCVSPLEEPSRVVSLRQGSHGVAPHNAGPPTTYDYMPIPCQSYTRVHGELQAKFNAYLAVGLAMLTGSTLLAVKTNYFATECLRAPNSWYERK